MEISQIEAKLIAAGVKNLKDYGYPKVSPENILTDTIYKGFFKSMLNDNKGHGKKIDEAINNLLLKIED